MRAKIVPAHTISPLHLTSLLISLTDTFLKSSWITVIHQMSDDSNIYNKDKSKSVCVCVLYVCLCICTFWFICDCNLFIQIVKGKQKCMFQKVCFPAAHLSQIQVCRDFKKINMWHQRANFFVISCHILLRRTHGRRVLPPWPWELCCQSTNSRSCRVN